MGAGEGPKNFESLEFTPFATALSYGEAPARCWTGFAELGELESKSECVTLNFNGLETGRR